MAYGGDSGSSDDWEMLYYCFYNGEVVDFMIVETGSGIFFMVPQNSELLCWIDTRAPGVRGSWIGLV